MNNYTNCKLYKNDKCSGLRCNAKNCGYEPIQHISEYERENWPKYGDATAFRKDEKREYN